MTKKSLLAIVNGIVGKVVLKIDPDKAEDAKVTPEEEDQARTLVAIALQRNRDVLVAEASRALLPVAPVAPVAPAVSV
jgi:hypothetical protein